MIQTKKIGNKNAFTVTNDAQPDAKLFYSYNTPVACLVGDTLFTTDAWYSQTTTRHISHFVGMCGYPRTTRAPQRLIIKMGRTLEHGGFIPRAPLDALLRYFDVAV